MATNPGPNNLETWWSHDETSGNRSDSHGSNTLVDNGTVGTAAGKQSNASLFDRDIPEYFTIADNASLKTGDIDYYWAGWIYLDSLPSDTTVFQILEKYGTAGNRGYSLNVATDDLLRFIDRDGTNAILDIKATTFGALSVATWYFCEAWHSATLNRGGVAIDRTEDSEATTGAPASVTVEFSMGIRTQGNVSPFDGRMDEVVFYKGNIPTSDERDWLYNSGAGRAYSEVSLILQPTPGVATAVGVAPTTIIKAIAAAGNALAVGNSAVLQFIRLLLAKAKTTKFLAVAKTLTAKAKKKTLGFYARRKR